MSDAHKIKVPREDLGNTMNPALSQEFIFFANRNTLRDMQIQIKIHTVCVYGTLKMFEVQPNQEQSQTNFHLLQVSKRKRMQWGDGEQKHTMFSCGLFVSFSAKNSVVPQNIEYTRQRVFFFLIRTFCPQKDKNL